MGCWKSPFREETPSLHSVDLNLVAGLRGTSLVASGPAEILSVVRDITESKRAEQELRESKERFRPIACHPAFRDVLFSGLDTLRPTRNPLGEIRH